MINFIEELANLNAQLRAEWQQRDEIVWVLQIIAVGQRDFGYNTGSIDTQHGSLRYRSPFPSDVLSR